MKIWKNNHFMAPRLRTYNLFVRLKQSRMEALVKTRWSQAVHAAVSMLGLQNQVHLLAIGTRIRMGCTQLQQKLSEDVSKL